MSENDFVRMGGFSIEISKVIFLLTDHDYEMKYEFGEIVIILVLLKKPV
jgi:hypothetical protein